jgi:outer membrane receptor protein involved in Fe transport
MREDDAVLESHIPGTPLFELSNAGTLKYQGLETGASWVHSPKLEVHGNAAFYHNRFGDFVDGDAVLTGNRLPIAPDYVINWGAALHPFTDSSNPYVSPIEILLDVKHVGDVVVDKENSFTLDPYTIVDLAGSWRWRQLRITLSAHNLLNSEYYSNGSTETADPGRPRQVLLTTSVKLK